MKAFGILEHELEDVFHIFMENVKKDFSDYNEEEPIGCQIKKSIQSVGPKLVDCTVEITGYINNQKYQITTSTSFSKCISTYTFQGQKNGTTKLIVEEEQTSEQFISYVTVYLQRFMARRNFKAKVNNLVESLNNELKA